MIYIDKICYSADFGQQWDIWNLVRWCEHWHQQRSLTHVAYPDIYLHVVCLCIGAYHP